MDDIRKQEKAWRENTLKKHLAKGKERKESFTTISDVPIKDVYTPVDIEKLDYDNDLGFPGEFPYARGIYPTMYRGRLWTMRQFAGFGTAEETNKRYHYLLSQGQTGLSVAFDMPTIMGVDSDDKTAMGEVGKCGVAIDSLYDMETLFDGIPLDKVTTSMTINAPAAILWAFYIAVAEKQGVSSDKIGGTIQNDILKEYIAQKSWIFPPEPSMRIIRDTVDYAAKKVPRWNTISISGYHIREAGSTALQELAFTIIDGISYVNYFVNNGLNVDDFAPRLSFFFDSHMDFFEEIAKFRAARRIWAKIMKERFNAKNPKSLLLRFHTQTAGCSLMAQQPYNNVIRTALEALSAVLGGTQSLHTNSMDETFALPTEEAVTIALRTQQIIGHESGVTNSIDPLAGSYFIEKLTNEMEEKTWEYINKIDSLGGMLKAIEIGFPQKEIQDAAYRYQLEIESKEKTIVGVNKYVTDEETEINLLKIAPEIEEKQKLRLEKVKMNRNNEMVDKLLLAIENAAKDEKENLMPFILDAVKEYATEGEIINSLKKVFGEYKDPAFF